MELFYFGAKFMHPKALEPAIEKEIPVRIKNTFNPLEEGTLIGKEAQKYSEKVVKAITVIKDTGLINISGAGMSGTPGVAAKIFSILGEKNINILLISQSSSEANISIVIKRNDLEKAVNLLEIAFLGKELVKEITFEDDVCIVSVVGAGMRGTIGVASRIFKAISEQKINVRIIAQGSSELNVSFVISEIDHIKAVKSLHKEFKLNNEN